MLWTCSTQGVALTYFSMRHVSVFSTSFGPSPGAMVPTTRTGGVSSGNVSTLILGVTTAAKTTTAMETIKIATGFFRDSHVTLDPPAACNASTGPESSATPWCRSVGEGSRGAVRRWHRSGRRARLRLRSLFRGDLVPVLQQRASLRHDPGARSEGRIEVHRAPGFSFDGDGLRMREIAFDDEQAGFRPAEGCRIQWNFRSRLRLPDRDSNLARGSHRDLP